VRSSKTRWQSGAAVIEFVIVAPVLLLVWFGLFNIGNAIQQKIWLEQAVRAGGIRALSAGDNPNAITKAVQNASWANVSVTTTVAPTPLCPDGSTLQSNGNCGSGPTFQFITITATVPFVSVGIPLPLTSLGAQYVEQLP
jgi:Flp pilus assembly protein TadG